MASEEKSKETWSDLEFIVFLDSIGRSDWHTCQKFMQQYPSILNAEGKDSSGNLLTALHKAVLCAPYAMCKLLVENGADVNSKTSNGDYVLLYACRRGNLPLTYLLLYHGAKTDVRDAQERGAVHFVCMSGQVGTFAFFEADDALFRIDLDAVDVRQRNALHYVIEFGHVELFHFMRKRPHLFEKLAFGCDSNGDTPLHIAIQRANPVLLHDGLEALARYELQRGAVTASATRQSEHTVSDLLSIRNTAGSSCVELARELANVSKASSATPSPYPRAGDPPGIGRAEGYRNMSKYELIRNYLDQGVRAPTKAATAQFFANERERAYRYALYSPVISSFVMFAVWLMAAYSQALVIKAVAVIFNLSVLYFYARDLLRADHRIMHISRTANPMFASFYGAGVIHTLLLLYIWTLPVAFGDDSSNLTSNSSADGSQTSKSTMYLLIKMLVFVATILFVAVYSHLLRVDPGYVTTGATHQRTGKRLTLLDCAVEGVAVERFCSVCEIFIDEIAVRHCRLCQRCVRDQDHHCIFLTRCVTRRLVKYFCAWLVLDVILQGTYIYSAVVFIGKTYRDTVHSAAQDEFNSALLTWFADSQWFIIIIGMSIVTGGWAMSLILYQIRMHRADRGQGHTHLHSHSHVHSRGWLSRLSAMCTWLCSRH